MHSSRMRTACSSSCNGVGLHTPPPEQAPPLEQAPLPDQALPWLDPLHLPPWVWAWTRSLSTSPLAVGLDQIPLNFNLGCGPGDPPGQIPLNFPLGCGPGNLQGMLGYHPPPGDLLQGMLGYHLQCMLGYYPLMWTE